VTVQTDVYEQVVGSFQKALQEVGIETERTVAPTLMRTPPKILALLAGGPIENLVAENMKMLVGSGFEMVLFPSDLMVRGEKVAATRARAAVVQEAAFSAAYLTWTKEAGRLERNLRNIWGRIHDRPEPALLRNALGDLDDFDKILATIPLEYEEWETLFRQRLQIERTILKTLGGLTAHPEEGRREERTEQRSSMAA
jgi:hypothetical protein